MSPIFFRIDAEKPDHGHGRFANDSKTERQANAKMVIMFNKKGQPRPCLFACKRILQDEETRWYYGPQLPGYQYPWRKKQVSNTSLTISLVFPIVINLKVPYVIFYVVKFNGISVHMLPLTACLTYDLYIFCCWPPVVTGRQASLQFYVLGCYNSGIGHRFDQWTVMRSVYLF